MHREENQSPLSGLSYAAVTWQLAVEAVVPLNNVSGRGVGGRSQLLLFLEDLAPMKIQWPSLKVSNFEQTLAVHICCFGNHRGIALSGPDPTPASIIGLGGVVLSRVSLCFC